MDNDDHSVDLNEKIIIPIINDIKNCSKEEKKEVFSFLDVKSGVLILEINQQLLEKEPSSGLNEIAIVGYEVLSKRINNMMKNDRLSCTKAKKEEINNLYYRLLDCKANTHKKHGVTIPNKNKTKRKKRY